MAIRCRAVQAYPCEPVRSARRERPTPAATGRSPSPLPARVSLELCRAAAAARTDPAGPPASLTRPIRYGQRVALPWPENPSQRGNGLSVVAALPGLRAHWDRTWRGPSH